MVNGMNAQEPTMLTALYRGMMGRCPSCGEGRMFGKFLKVKDTCDVCGEELFHHRADDLPAYIVMVIVGHVVVTLLLVVEAAYEPPFWVHAALWFPLTIALSLVLLQPVKGIVVALQWKLGMHGFGGRPGLNQGRKQSLEQGLSQKATLPVAHEYAI